MKTDRHPGGYDPKVGGYRGASLPPGVKPVPPKGPSADIPIKRKGAVAGAGVVPDKPPRPSTVGGYSAGPKRVADLESPPKTSGPGAWDVEGLRSGNWYLREYVKRLEEAVDAGRRLFETGRPDGIEQLAARIQWRWAMKRLDGDE